DGYIMFTGNVVNPSQVATLTANAGADQTVYSGNTVYLNGSGSTGNSLTYSWSCSSGISLSNSNTANPTFVAPGVSSGTTYTCALTVTDSNLSSKSDTVNIIVIPQVVATTSTNTGLYYTGNINAEMLTISDNRSTAALLNAKILECSSGNCKARFIWGTNANSLTNQTKWVENLKQGSTFSYPLTGLKKGGVYYAGLEVQMGSKTFKISGDQALKFITMPDKPSSLAAKLKTNTSIELNWKMGEGGDIVLIKRRINTCPTALETGSPTIYYGQGETIVDDGLSPNTSYCYRAWMVTYDGSKLIYSDPAEVLISTKSTASTSGAPVKSTTTKTLASQNENKKFSLSTSARNISLGETSYKKNVSAGAGDNIEFSVEVKNTGDSKLENIIVKNLISSELAVKSIFIDNVSHSTDAIDNAYIKELGAGKTAKINFTLTMGEYQNAGSIMVLTEASADGLNPMTDTVNVQKNAIVAVDDTTSEGDTMEASFFSTLMAGNLFPWSILALILLVLLIVYFSLKEERKNK
ncbi:MAG: hypothetical protein PHY30_01810, partial [Candidatus Pacebacteria bacterium]|nr:hypothetical protein [Candidatus Paceibacterota bacterium]